MIMPSPQPSPSRDPPGFPSSNTLTRHNPGPGMLPQIMQTRLISCAIGAADAGAPTELSERPPDGTAPQPTSCAIDEERRLGGLRKMSVLSLLTIVAHRPAQIWTERHQPRLVEFRVADGHYGRWQVDVGERQVKRFADAQPRSV